ncbi:hypothetical protein HDV05_007917, partial [Chytridiales sp. JEL 0842]
MLSQSLFSTLFFHIVWLQSTTTTAAPSNPLLVNLPIGSVLGIQGTPDSTVSAPIQAFLGLPFSRPPVRFTPPSPPTPWTGTYDATYFREKCVQAWSGEGSEDCLYLNVYRGVGVGEGSKVPVVVYVHGGAFSGGDARDFSGPAKIVAASSGSMIVVTIQYRLHFFGFLAHPTLVQNGWANLGIQDQRAALEWVRDYISFFGGNPGSVTLMGQSAGA